MSDKIRLGAAATGTSSEWPFCVRWSDSGPLRLLPAILVREKHLQYVDSLRLLPTTVPIARNQTRVKSAGIKASPSGLVERCSKETNEEPATQRGLRRGWKMHRRKTWRKSQPKCLEKFEVFIYVILGTSGPSDNPGGVSPIHRPDSSHRFLPQLPIHFACLNFTAARCESYRTRKRNRKCSPA